MKDNKVKNQYNNHIKTLLLILGIVVVILTILTLLVVDNKINEEKPYTIELYEKVNDKFVKLNLINNENAGNLVIEKGRANTVKDHSKFEIEGYKQIINDSNKSTAVQKILPNGKTVFKLYFEKEQYDVIFRGYGNTDFGSQKIKYRDKIDKQSLAIPKKDKYVFKYWSLFENGKEFDFSREEIKENITLYPVFERQTTTYKEIYYLQNIDDDGYTKEEHIRTNVFVGDEVNIDVSSKPGFDYVKHDGEKISDILSENVEDNEVICYLNRKKYSVTFELDGGDAVLNKDQLNEQIVKFGGRIIAPTNVVIDKANAEFQYWKEGSKGKEEVNFNDFVVTKDVSFWAHYKIIKTSCRIEYYLENIDGTEFIKDNSNTEIKNVIVGSTYNFEEKNIEGFTFDHANANNILSVVIDTENNEYIMKAYYKRSNYNVIVKYLKPNGEKVFDLNNEIIVSKYGQELVLSAKVSSKGYKYVGDDKTYVTTSAVDQEVEFNYVVDEEQQFEAVINYYIEASTEIVPNVNGQFGIAEGKKVVSGYVTQEFNIDVPNFQGINEYVVLENHPTKVIISEKEQVEINIYYKDVSRLVDVSMNLGTKTDPLQLKYFKYMPKILLEQYVSKNVDDTVAKPEYREYDGIAYISEGIEHFIKSTEDVILPDNVNSIVIYWRTPADYYYDFYETNGGAGAKNNKFVTIEEGTTIIPSRTAWNDTIPTGLYANVLNSKNVKIFINENVKHIYDRAFQNCSKIIGKIYLNKDIIRIESQAFYGCEGITEINSNNGVLELENIGDSAFENAIGLSKIGIFSKILSIGKSAFKNCVSLNKILLNKDITVIQESAFQNCSNLTIEGALDLSKVTVLGKYAFQGCTNLTSNIIFNNSLTVINEYVFNKSGITGSLDLSYITEIKESAFERCEGLNGSITFGEGLVSIGKNAFKDDKYITGNLILPSTVRIVNDYAFYSCKEIVMLQLNNGLEEIGEQAFSHMFKLKGETVSGNLTLPNSIKSIKSSAFLKCQQLEGVVTFPTNADYIEISVQMFQGCGKIKQLVIPNNIIKIGARAFYECKEINTPVDIKNIVEINESVFENCNNIPKFELSPQLKIVKKNAFYKCLSWVENGLDLSVMTGIDRVNEGAFFGCSKLTGTLKLPEKSEFLVEKETFALCGFTKIDFGNRITTIQERAFNSCLQLEEIILYDSISKIGNGAFEGCNKFKQDLVFKVSIAIGDEAFKLSGIKSIQLMQANSSIGKAAFNKCDQLLTVKMKDSEAVANTWLNWKEGMPSSVVVTYNV